MKHLGYNTIIKEDGQWGIQKHDVLLDVNPLAEDNPEETQTLLTNIENDPDFICWINVDPGQGYIFYNLDKPILLNEPGVLPEVKKLAMQIIATQNHPSMKE